jgi:membrane protein YdbS with pleckstrin-like domain
VTVEPADLPSGAGRARDPLFDPADIRWRRVSPKLARLWQLVAALWFGPVIAVTAGAFTAAWALTKAPVALLVGGPAVAVLAALWCWVGWLIPRRAGAIGYVERASDMIIRKGLLVRAMKVVPYGRMQYLDVTSGPLQRRFGLATLRMNTAASSLTASLPGLPQAEAARLRDHLADLGNARMAGL